MITIYSKPDCIFCSRAKDYMHKHNIEYKEFLMGRDISRDQILEQFPQMRTMPIIFLDDKLLGGYTQMVEHFGGEYKRVDKITND